MRIEVDTANIWMRIACFAFRRAAKANGQEPDGIPFRRSKEAFCDGFENRKKLMGDWDGCMTDGHYLCDRCCHRAESQEKEE